ncbi:hypothetical protein EDD16DRAFT_1759934 [Pisolithus croceorrhizus]|nr:hypothetical protein EDD16DRAFT_1759934 [Pisolithus croceorrhizus]KAI6141351.1 hypothetical protein EDD17DRAFT_1769793 [Pisolithus thermaeus]
MPRCLRIIDILDLIFGYVVDESVADTNVTGAVLHGDIARLAGTCMAFMDPALDILWKTQSSLSPLVMCLPAHLWILEVDQGVKVVEPSHGDWLTMKRYSHRIRAIDLTTLNLPTVRLNIVDAVFSPGLSNELFPSLHALGPNVTSGLPPPDPILFPGPIRLPQLEPSFAFCASLCAIPQVLKITAARVNLNTNATLEVNFGRIPYLRSLYLSYDLNVSPSSLHELIRLQCLRDLTVPLPDGFDVGARPSVDPILSSLQRITITLGSIQIFHHSPAAENDIYRLFQEIEHIRDRFPDFYTFDVQRFYPIKPIALPIFDLPQSILTDLHATACVSSDSVLSLYRMLMTALSLRSRLYGLTSGFCICAVPKGATRT